MFKADMGEALFFVDDDVTFAAFSHHMKTAKKSKTFTDVLRGGLSALVNERLGVEAANVHSDNKSLMGIA